MQRGLVLSALRKGASVRNIVKSFGEWLVSRSSSVSDFATEAGITGTDTERLTNPYEKSVWVNRAIKKIATPISSVPLVFSEVTDGATPVEDPNLLKFWRDPFLDLTFEDGIEATIGWLKLQGEAFWVCDDEWLMPFPNPARLAQSKILIANPARMREVVEGSRVVAWHYIDPHGRSHVFDPKQVHQPKFWHPRNPHRGLAEMLCAEIASESDYMAGSMARNLNRSNGDRGVYVMAKGQGVTGEQRDQIIAQLRAKQRANQRGKAVATFLNGGDFSIEDPKLQSLDDAQLTARLHNRHEIFIAFGVPPSMADIQSSYSIGAASDRFVLIEDTCIPTGNKLCGFVERISAPIVGREVRAQFDWDEHSVMQQVRGERMKNADTLFAKGVPMKEINEILNLGVSEYPGWEVGYLPMTLLPAAAVAAGANDLSDDPDYAEKGTSNIQRRTSNIEVDEMIAALQTRAAKPATKAEDPEPEDFQDKRPKKEIALWNAQMASRRTTQRKFKNAFTRTLFDARKHVLQRIDEVYTPQEKSAVKRAAAGDLIFTLDIFETGLLAAMRQVAKGALDEAGQQVFTEIGLDDVFTMAPEKVLLHLRARENLLKNTAAAIHREVMDSLEAGIQAGESTAKLAGRVKTTFNGISDRRAVTIAQTETNTAYNYARQDSMTQAGVTHKQWLTSGNRNVRASHAAANGQTVPVDEDFEVDGEPLAHPGDSNGSAENTINCHCLSIAAKAPKD